MFKYHNYNYPCTVIKYKFKIKFKLVKLYTDKTLVLKKESIF